MLFIIDLVQLNRLTYTIKNNEKKEIFISSNVCYVLIPSNILFTNNNLWMFINNYVWLFWKEQQTQTQLYFVSSKTNLKQRPVKRVKVSEKERLVFRSEGRWKQNVIYQASGWAEEDVWRRLAFCSFYLIYSPSATEKWNNKTVKLAVCDISSRRNNLRIR